MKGILNCRKVNLIYTCMLLNILVNVHNLKNIFKY